ncbi:hypothetical protein [Devosia sp.]|uniref:hypothetical protein n=1 Tax=Devosia sp. TaxID=1871048 RepID=UPI003A900518
MSALSIATAGMTAASDRFERSASAVARLGTPAGAEVDIAAETVAVIDAQAQFEILAAGARRASEMSKSAIDIIA